MEYSENYCMFTNKVTQSGLNKMMMMMMSMLMMMMIIILSVNGKTKCLKGSRPACLVLTHLYMLSYGYLEINISVDNISRELEIEHLKYKHSTNM